MIPSPALSRGFDLRRVGLVARSWHDLTTSHQKFSVYGLGLTFRCFATGVSSGHCSLRDKTRHLGYRANRAFRLSCFCASRLCANLEIRGPSTHQQGSGLWDSLGWFDAALSRSRRHQQDPRIKGSSRTYTMTCLEKLKRRANKGSDVAGFVASPVQWQTPCVAFREPALVDFVV